MAIWFILLGLVQAFKRSECELSNLSSGHFNIRSERQFKKVTRDNELLLLGVSASWCTHCCLLEPALSQLKDLLTDFFVKFTQPAVPIVRVDTAAHPFMQAKIQDSSQLPQLYGIKKGKFYRYLNFYDPKIILSFIHKLNNPVLELKSEQEVENFMKVEGEQNFLRTIAFIFDEERDEDSVYAQYENVAYELVNWQNLEMAKVTNRELIKSLLDKKKFVKYHNSLALQKRKSAIKYLDLALSQDIYKWILNNGISLVDELTAYNFPLYKATGQPMLLMFIDPNNASHYKHLSVFEKVAAIFEDEIKFVWLDGTEETNRKRKRALGLVTENLPGVAFNLLDTRTVPFDEATELNKENLISFVHDFLDHKLESKNNPAVNSVDPEYETLYKDTPKLQGADFKDKVLLEGYDVLVLFYTSYKDENSLQLAPNFNKLSKRFEDLEYPNIRIYRMDIAQESVPKFIRVDQIPAIYFFPAFKKSPPYVQYTGEAKIVPMMFFVEKYADISITLPELPHLHPSQVPDYYKQIEELDEEKRQKVKEANERRHWEF